MMEGVGRPFAGSDEFLRSPEGEQCLARFSLAFANLVRLVGAGNLASVVTRTLASERRLAGKLAQPSALARRHLKRKQIPQILLLF